MLPTLHPFTQLNDKTQRLFTPPHWHHWLGCTLVGNSGCTHKTHFVELCSGCLPAGKIALLPSVQDPSRRPPPYSAVSTLLKTNPILKLILLNCMKCWLQQQPFNNGRIPSIPHTSTRSKQYWLVQPVPSTVCHSMVQMSNSVFTISKQQNQRTLRQQMGFCYTMHCHHKSVAWAVGKL
jgi:hypothetical protein